MRQALIRDEQTLRSSRVAELCTLCEQQRHIHEMNNIADKQEQASSMQVCCGQALTFRMMPMATCFRLALSVQ